MNNQCSTLKGVYVLARCSYERERVDFAAFHSLTLVATLSRHADGRFLGIDIATVRMGHPDSPKADEKHLQLPTTGGVLAGVVAIWANH